MATGNGKVQSVQKIVKRGEVKHAQIQPQLQQQGLGKLDPDAIAELTLKYVHNVNPGAAGKLIKQARRLGDKVGGYVAAIVGGAIVAETMATRELSGTLIDDKLQGFGDHLKYWLGMKSVEVSGPEMMDAMTKVVAATPEIVKGMLIGAVLGYVVWKAGTRFGGFLYKRKRLQRDIQQLLR